MKVLPEDTGQFSTPPKQQHQDALAPICEINEQCLQMLVGAARQSRIPPDNFLFHLFSLVSPLNDASIVTAARFPFLLVDFGFRDPQWWRRIASRNSRAEAEPSWLVPYPRATAMKLARATLTLAWHTARTDADATLVLLGIGEQVADQISSLRLRDIRQDRRSPLPTTTPSMGGSARSLATITGVFTRNRCQRRARVRAARPTINCRGRPSLHSVGSVEEQRPLNASAIAMVGPGWRDIRTDWPRFRLALCCGRCKRPQRVG